MSGLGICLCNSLIGLEQSQLHWSLAQNRPFFPALGHRSLALIECIPLVGKLTAVTDRFVSSRIGNKNRNAASLDSRQIKSSTLPITTPGKEVTREEAPLSIRGKNQPKVLKLLTPEQAEEVLRIYTTQPLLPERPIDISLDGHSGIEFFAGAGAGAGVGVGVGGASEGTSEIVKSLESGKLRVLSPQESMKKMKVNFIKAITEHSSKMLYRGIKCYATVEEIKNSELLATTERLRFTFFESSSIGKSRKTMEDAHFFMKTPAGVLMGVFDGHGDSGLISNRVKERFQARFISQLALFNHDVHKTFEFLFIEIDRALSIPGGSTAVLTFIQNGTNLVYTATLGDSESNIYRKLNDVAKSIPLSVLRNWSSKKEASRMALYQKDETIATDWPLMDGKSLRTPPTSYHGGLNVSRAFGDYDSKSSITPCIINKPKITVAKILPGDLVVLACDGLKDFVPEIEIKISLFNQISREPNLAKRLVDCAIQKMTALSGDNVTVIVLQVSK